jgi:hypothetical protein
MPVQILKLGLSGSEITLPVKSRINEQGAPTYFKNTARSANKTLHIDYIAKKLNWTITWEVISEADFNTISAIVDLQYSTPANLSFIYTTENGTEVTKIVDVEISSKGALMQRDIYFDSGLTLSIVEV